MNSPFRFILVLNPCLYTMCWSSELGKRNETMQVCDVTWHISCNSEMTDCVSRSITLKMTSQLEVPNMDTVLLIRRMPALCRSPSILACSMTLFAFLVRHDEHWHAFEFERVSAHATIHQLRNVFVWAMTEHHLYHGDAGKGSFASRLK